MDKSKSVVLKSKVAILLLIMKKKYILFNDKPSKVVAFTLLIKKV